MPATKVPYRIVVVGETGSEHSPAGFLPGRVLAFGAVVGGHATPRGQAVALAADINLWSLARLRLLVVAEGG